MEHLNLMLVCDEDAEHTIGCAVTRTPTFDHNIVDVAGEKLKLHLLSLLNCVLVRFYEFLHVSARSVHGSVACAFAHFRRFINKDFDLGWHALLCLHALPVVCCQRYAMHIAENVAVGSGERHSSAARCIKSCVLQCRGMMIPTCGRRKRSMMMMSFYLFLQKQK